MLNTPKINTTTAIGSSGAPNVAPCAPQESGAPDDFGRVAAAADPIVVASALRVPGALPSAEPSDLPLKVPTAPPPSDPSLPPFLTGFVDPTVVVMPQPLTAIPSLERGKSTITLGGGRHYSLSSSIGNGQAGHVYRGRDNAHSCDVAIKIVHCARPGHDPSREIDALTMRNEIVYQHQCRGPHVTEIVDAAEFNVKSGGKCFIIVTPLAKDDLLGHLAKTSKEPGAPAEPLHPRLALHYLIQLASALQRIHGQGLIHHDIKPDNILVLENEAGVYLELTDFGFIEDVGVDAERRSRRFLGTPLYMAPEIDERSRLGHGKKVDIFSLGAVFYTLLKGHAPFPEDNRIRWIKRNKGGAWPLTNIPEPITALVTAMLHYDEEARPTAKQVVERATAILANMP